MENMLHRKHLSTLWHQHLSPTQFMCNKLQKGGNWRHTQSMTLLTPPMSAISQTRMGAVKACQMSLPPIISFMEPHMSHMLCPANYISTVTPPLSQDWQGRCQADEAFSPISASLPDFRLNKCPSLMSLEVLSMYQLSLMNKLLFGKLEMTSMN